MSDPLVADVEWIAVSAGQVPAASDAALSRYFTLSDHVGLFTDQTVPRNLWVVPQLMRPTNSFHELATRALTHFGVPGSRQLPYREVLISQLRTEIVSLAVDLFPGDIRVSYVRAQIQLPHPSDLAAMLDAIAAARTAKQIPVIETLIRELLALSSGDRHRPRNQIRFSTYFSIGLTAPFGFDVFDTRLEAFSSDIVKLLIGAPSVSSLRTTLVEEIFEANPDLNAKAAGERLLINRQGAVYLVANGEYQGTHGKRLSRVRDLARLGLFAQALMRDEHQFSLTNPVLAELIRTRLAQWIEFPELTFDASVSQTVTWETIVKAFLLRSRLAAWSKFLDGNRDQLLADLMSRDLDWWRPQSLDSLRDLRRA